MSRYLMSLLLVCASSFAHADKRSDAKKYFRAGEQAFNAGQYSAAAQAFEESYSRVPLPAIAFSTAQALRLQYVIDKDPQRLRRAVELYRQYLEDVKQGGRRTDVVDALSVLEPALARLDVSGSPVTAKLASYKLLVTTEAANATASLNGADKSPIPLSQVIEPGKYTVRIEAPGYHPKTETFEVFEGQRFKLIEAELAPKPANVAIVAEDGTSVYVDGRSVATTPLSKPLQLPHGKHVVSLTRRGRYSYATEVSLSRGQSLDLSPALETTTQRKLAWTVWGVAAATALAAGGATALALVSQSEASDIDQRRTSVGITEQELADYARARDRRDTFRTLSIGLGASAVALGGAGLALYLLDTSGPSDAIMSSTRGGGATAVAPVVGPSTVGFSVSSSF